MKCNQIMEEYLEQEDNNWIPFKIKIHLFFCKKCRAEVFAMGEAMNIFKIESPYITGSMSEEIMKEIDSAVNPYYKDVLMWHWVLTGVVICSAIVLVNYSQPFIWLREHFGRSMEIPLNIVWGIIITLYVGSFVGTHIEVIKNAIKETVPARFRFK